MQDDFDPERDVDLDPSEWTYLGKKEPFWGSNAKLVGIQLLIAPFVVVIATFLVTGDLPQWLWNLLR